MSSKKMMMAYQNASREAVAESDNPHALISVLFDELLRAMRAYLSTIERHPQPQPEQNGPFSRALTILYGLQSSLNFDEGGEIAENLFRLYEYARQQLLTAAREGDTNGAVTAIEAIESIREAWSQIDGSSKVQPSGEAAE
jgi:flagellar protein FliS